MVTLKKRKRKSNKSEEQIWLQTRTWNELFYTKTHVNNDNSEKSTGGALPKIVSFIGKSYAILKMPRIKKGVHKILEPRLILLG